MLRRSLEEALHGPPSWLLPVLLPLSYLYAAAAALNRGLYHADILRQREIPRPVVSVGNITAGGGGKTPVTMWLAEALTELGLKPAVLTRGYGRKGTGVEVVDTDASWRNYGDEPAMMAARLPEIPVVVSANRYDGGMELLDRHDVDIFILDDGFQHYLLKRDLDVVAIDGNRKFGNGRLLPAGILREPVSSLKNADIIIVTKTGTKDPVFEAHLNHYTTAPVYWSDYQPLGLSRLDPPGSGSVMERPPGPLLAFCGIAGPAGFRRTLEKANVEILDLLVFPDHHHYSDADWENITAAAVEKKAVGLVTTEKDTVRLPSLEASLPVYSLPVRLEVDGSEEILEQVLALVSSERTASLK